MVCMGFEPRRQNGRRRRIHTAMAAPLSKIVIQCVTLGPLKNALPRELGVNIIVTFAADAIQALRGKYVSYI